MMIQTKRTLYVSFLLLAGTSAALSQSMETFDTVPQEGMVQAIPDVVPPKGTVEYFKYKVREFKKAEEMSDVQSQETGHASALIEELREKNQQLEQENEALKGHIHECPGQATPLDGGLLQ